MAAAIAEAQTAVEAAEANGQALHAGIHELEERLQTIAQQEAAAQGSYARANEVIAVNSQRIAEYRSFAERDGREIEGTRRQIEELRLQTESLEQKTRLLSESLASSRDALEEAEEAFKTSQDTIDALRLRVQTARTQSVQCDRRAAEIRDEIARSEATEREAIVRCERLAADKATLASSLERARETLAAIEEKANAARDTEQGFAEVFESTRTELDDLRARIEEAREHLGEMQGAAAAKEAQLEMLKDEAAAKTVLESVLQSEEGDVKIAAIANPGRAGVAVGDRLIDHMPLEGRDLEIAEDLLGDVVLTGGEKGVWFPSTGMAASSGKMSPITEAETTLASLREKIADAKDVLANGAERVRALSAALGEAEARLGEARRAAAQCEGEESAAKRDAQVLAARLEKTAAELEAASAQNADGAERRKTLAAELEDTIVRRDSLMDGVAADQEELRSLESQSMLESQRLTERRITVSQMEQELSFVGRQNEGASKRREELERQIEGRESGIKGYEESIERLSEESAELMAGLDDLRERAATLREQMDVERSRRGEMMQAIAAADRDAAEKRRGLDQARDFRAKLEVQAAEISMRRQNIYDHLQDEYGLFAESVLREPDPDWRGGIVPQRAELDAKIARLQSDIAALGPVNMVAIDECRELEERYAREKEQEQDLIAAKSQIMDLINTLNTTSSQMFRTTFEQANKNFQEMFTKLFGGGEARLVLLENAEDPLECGIDIIARPPGKRPQSVTLLSGGERTMTAVALLFSIFLIKPAPFSMLDELDAALDDANIGRFVEQLKSFLVKSQFLIITHNQHTIAGADLVYGVSQQEKGVSRVLSMKLADLGVKKED